jgi:hydrogenase expression/formation protein HypE
MRSANGIRAVLFDFDGTLTRPGSIDFAAVKRRLGCPAELPVLEYIAALDSDARRAQAFRTLEEVELDAARRSLPNEGAEEFVRLLSDGGIGRGIISRNGRASIETALRNFSLVESADFGVVLSRENSGRPKPSPDGVLLAAQALGVLPAELLVVGDYLFDIQAGCRAGAKTAFLTNGAPLPDMDARPDHVVDRLLELTDAVFG